MNKSIKNNIIHAGPFTNESIKVMVGYLWFLWPISVIKDPEIIVAQAFEKAAAKIKVYKQRLKVICSIRGQTK